MIADDAYRHGLQGIVEGLRYWVPAIADVAHIAEDGGADFWHLNITSRMPGGCPFEMLLRHDQTYDMVIAGETYEYLPVPSLAMFLPMAEAIIDGRVVQRHWISRQTGARHAIETLVFLSDGSTWCEGNKPDGSCENRDRHFLPYRR